MRKKDKKQLQEEKDLIILASEETTNFREIAKEIGFSYSTVMKIKQEFSELELKKILENFKKNKKNATNGKKARINNKDFEDFSQQVLNLAKTGKYSSLSNIAKELQIPASTLNYRVKKSSLYDEIINCLCNKKNKSDAKKVERKKSIKEVKEIEEAIEEIKLEIEKVKITDDNKEMEYTTPNHSIVIDTSVMGIANITEILNKMLKKNIKIGVIEPVLVELDCLSKDKENINTAQKAKNLIRYIFMNMSRICFLKVRKEVTVDETVIVTAKRTKSLMISADMVQCLRAGIQGVDFRAYVIQDKDITYMQYCKNNEE